MQKPAVRISKEQQETYEDIYDKQPDGGIQK